MDSIRDALDAYRNRLERYCEREYGGLPAIPYSDELEAAMLIAPPDADGEVAWRLVPVRHMPDWAALTERMGFSPSDDLRAFFGTYLFGSLCGCFNGVQLYLEPHVNEALLGELLYAQHCDALCVFPQSQRFLLGSAIWQGDDEYGVYYDNADGRIFCHASEGEDVIPLTYGFAALIRGMEAFD